MPLLSTVLGYATPGYIYLGGHSGVASSSPDLTISVSDKLDLQDFGDWNPYTAHSDQLALSDNVQVDFLIFVEPLLISVSDKIELGEHQLIIQHRGADEQIDIYEEFKLSDPDEIGPGIPGSADVSDVLTLSDEVALSVDGFVEAFDTLQDKWFDSIQMSLEQSFALADTLALSDAVNVNLIVVGITQSLSDSFALSDGVALQLILNEILEDRVVLSDEVQLQLAHFLEVGDLIALSDAITLAHDSIFSFDDTLSLLDAVEIILSQPLTVGVSDALLLSDEVGVIRGGSDLSYLRRYLNDIQ